MCQSKRGEITRYGGKHSHCSRLAVCCLSHCNFFLLRAKFNLQINLMLLRRRRKQEWLYLTNTYRQTASFSCRTCQKAQHRTICAKFSNCAYRSHVLSTLCTRRFLCTLDRD